MLVEDNETNRIVATDNLRRFGLAVSIARDGQEAVEQVKTHRFDLILMDLQMPVMDGFEATAAIRARDTEVPIIALSAAVMEQDRQRTEAVSMQGRLTKPIDVALLHATLARFLPESQTPVPAAPDDALPAIPGVNVDALTARMGGDVRRRSGGCCKASSPDGPNCWRSWMTRNRIHRRFMPSSTTSKAPAATSPSSTSTASPH